MASERIILEEFVEGITLLPNEIRRNFELMKSLDRSSSIVLCELSECEKRALQRAKRKLRESSGALAQPGADRRAIIEDPELNAEVESKRYKAQEMVDEKVAIAEQTLEIVEAHLHRLDSDLTQFEAHLRAAGEFETVGAAKEGDEVAVRLNAFENAWILASVIEYKPDTGYYEVADADDPHKTYEVQESQVNELNSANGEGARLTKGEEVLAVYPDTTSFYTATVTQPPRRGGAAGPTCCCVQFVDDADETGITPDRQVPLRYVIRPL